MFDRHFKTIAFATLLALAAPPPLAAASIEKPVAGKEVRFEKGFWSGVPLAGPDGKVRQCNIVALRQRAGTSGPVKTNVLLGISKGSGLSLSLKDDSLPTEQVLDDQAEILIDGHDFPAVGFTLGSEFVFHPGDAAGVQTALAKAVRVELRSDGAGIDSGAILINLTPEALNWLTQCGKMFDIAIDRPTDPDAQQLPTPRPRSPKVSITVATPAGPPGIEDKQKIFGWDASELRNDKGEIFMCLIRRHYRMGGDPNTRWLGTFLIANRAGGFSMMLKDSSVNTPEGQPVEATLSLDDQPFTAFTAQMLGHDEVGIRPQHAAELAKALEYGARAKFKSSVSVDQFEFPVQNGVVPWLRACARRNGIPFEPAGL